MPAPVPPTPPKPQAAALAQTAAPPPWVAALIGAGVGVVSMWLLGLIESMEPFYYALSFKSGFVNSFPMSAAGLIAGVAAVWTLGLGAVFLDMWQAPKRKWLGLVGLCGVVALATATQMQEYSPQISVTTVTLVLPALLALSGAALLQGWQPGRSKEERNSTVDGRRSLSLITEAPLLYIIAAALGMVFYALLQLAAALADTVGIATLQQLLNNPNVAVPLVLGASAFFVAALRSARWGRSLTATLGGVVAYLLPVAALVVAVFIALLPVAALQDTAALFEGFLNSYLYLTLTTIFAVLTLYAFQPTEPEAAAQSVLPPTLAIFSRAVAYALPLFPLLALYGLISRVSAYGLTEMRVLGLSLTFWWLLFALGLALTKLRPPFAGLAPMLPVALAGLAAICALLSFPGLRPTDIALRSQTAMLSRAGLDAEQARSALVFLAERGKRGQQVIAGLDRSSLPQTAQAALAKLEELGTEKYLSQRNQSQTAPQITDYRFEPLAQSAALSPAQAQALAAQLRLINKENDYEPLCDDMADHCAVSVYLLPMSNGNTRAILPVFYDNTAGRWFDFAGTPDAPKIVRGGFYGQGDHFSYAEADPQPLDWTAQASVKVVQREVLSIGGHEVPFFEVELPQASENSAE